MSDYRDLPIQVARRAAERNRQSALRSERWRTGFRAMAWVLGAAGIAVVTVLAQPLWQPYVGGQRLQDGRAVVARAERAQAQGEATVSGDDRSGRAPGQTAPAVAAAAARTVPGAGDVAAHPAQPASAQAPSARDAMPVEPPAIAVDADDEPEAGPTDSTALVAEEIETLRRDADEDLRRGRLEQAATGYRAVLERSVDDEAAEEGLANVAAAHAARAQRLAADFEFDGAEKELAIARGLAPDTDAIRDATGDLAQARALRARIPSAAGAAQQDRVRSLLDEATAAMARGELMDPPGESAFDKIAAARALAPNAPEVRSAADRLERARRTQGDRPATPR
jgi:hypothetical protein